MKDLIEIFYAQSHGWQLATIAAAITVVGLVAFCIAAFFRELVEMSLGPIRLRILIWQVKRETKRIALEDAEREERRRLDVVVRFPVH